MIDQRMSSFQEVDDEANSANDFVYNFDDFIDLRREFPVNSGPGFQPGLKTELLRVPLPISIAFYCQ
jgi:hypothetical protein